MNIEFITNGDDDEVHVPREGSSGILWLTPNEILFRFEGMLSEKEEEELKRMIIYSDDANPLNIQAGPVFWEGFNEAMKKELDEFITKQKEYGK
jgi:hypothetical protein